jgi:hypothetical protein
LKLKRGSLGLWLLLVIGISLLLFVGIKLFSGYPQGIAVYRGVYHTGFEISMFTPCGADEGMDAEGNLQKIYDFISPVPPQGLHLGDNTEVYIEINAQVSPPGSYGNLGAFSRQVNMIDVVKVQN